MRLGSSSMPRTRRAAALFVAALALSVLVTRDAVGGTNLPAVALAKAIAPLRVEAGGQVKVTLTVTAGNLGGGSVSQFFLTDQMPPGFEIVAEDASRNGAPIRPLREYGRPGDVYADRWPSRWVLSLPQHPGGTQLVEGDVLAIHYTLRVPPDAPQGAIYALDDCSWVGTLAGQGTAPVYGFREATGIALTVVYRGNHPPAVPSATSPQDGQAPVSVTPVLRWLGGDPDGGDSLTYSVHLGVGNPPPRVASGLSGRSLFPGTLRSQTRHYWRVVATDSAGLEAASPVWSFTTALDPSDHDHDGLADALERSQGADPSLTDTDGDGLPDGTEVALTMTNPSLVSTDGVLEDGEIDSDGDGVVDAAEVANKTALDVPDSVYPHPEWADAGPRLLEADAADAFGPVLRWKSDPTMSGWALEFSSDFFFGEDVVRHPPSGWILDRTMYRPSGTRWLDVKELGRRVTVRVLGKSGTGSVYRSDHRTIQIHGGAEDLTPSRRTYSWGQPYRLAPSFSWRRGGAAVGLQFSSHPDFPPRATILVPRENLTIGAGQRARLSRDRWQDISRLGRSVFWRVASLATAGAPAYSPAAFLTLEGGPIYAGSLRLGPEAPKLNWYLMGNAKSALRIQDDLRRPTHRLNSPRSGFSTVTSLAIAPRVWDLLTSKGDELYLRLSGLRRWEGREVRTFSTEYGIEALR